MLYAAPVCADPLEVEVLEPPLVADSGELFGEASYHVHEIDGPSMRSSPPVATITPYVDLLCWKLTEGSAENWAQEITPQGSSGSLAGTATLVDAPFDWDAGLRVGLDYALVDGGPQASLYYTYFNTGATNEAAGDVYSAFLGNFFAGNPDGTGFGPHYESGHINWDVQFHTIDLEVGRNLFVSRALALRPFVGLKSAIIRQQIHSSWHDPIDSSSQDYLFSSATENLTQKIWGIGPAVGVEARAPLSLGPDHALSVYFSPSGALMYGSWSFSDQFQTDGPTSTTIPVPSSIAINSEPIRGAATMLRLACGLEWEQCSRRVNTRLRVGFEGQVWLNQMQYYSYNMGRLNNLMSLQGSILEFGINY
ncbi:Lpg1974 family pore-forming outer membrane protein [Aeoliella sp. ICT_H6.2]|uniref:Lpg1974 family pore-forming outer membrane protein n=1 Tax=Aeoliella straminimaris TaxID=2954799 RepID=A0A9X2FJG7_9BACT|nr:Lpg1974 family pore-forming outer membrane protein [Aeoliella straminimaris]MCO6047161.1 Lpg1974 family pore-forming outer membrane protein [Aeoliella straminimaris]